MALLRILFLVCSPKKMAKHSKWFVSEPINRLLQLKNECKQISSKVGTNFNANGNRFSTTYSQFRRIFHIYSLALSNSLPLLWICWSIFPAQMLGVAQMRFNLGYIWWSLLIDFVYLFEHFFVSNGEYEHGSAPLSFRKTTNVLWWLLTNWNDATGCDIVIGFSCNTARDSVMGKTKEQRGNELVERRNKSCVQKTNW